MIPKYRARSKSRERFEQVQHLIWHRDELTRVITSFTCVIHTNLPEDVILMQSTGLFDSRSEPVEIYKDDIVKRTSLIPGGSDMIGVVKMLEGCWVIDDGKQAVPLWTEVDENIVIGNIHENPELVAG